MSELVIKYSLHRSTIQQILLRNGVKLHKNKSFIKCNKKFFSGYNAESCYWAGFILADGNLRKDRNSLQIKLSKLDKEHLYSFLKSIECEDKSLVKEYKDYVSLTISLDEFKNDLINNFQITPNKTYTCIISEKIPLETLTHFIRGYMDGDGCVSVYDNGTRINLSFVGTEKLLEVLRNYFKDVVGIKLKSKNIVPPISNLKNGVGSIGYSGQNAVKILDKLYHNISGNCCLIRKYIKYKEYGKR